MAVGGGRFPSWNLRGAEAREHCRPCPGTGPHTHAGRTPSCFVHEHQSLESGDRPPLTLRRRCFPGCRQLCKWLPRREVAPASGAGMGSSLRPKAAPLARDAPSHSPGPGAGRARTDACAGDQRVPCPPAPDPRTRPGLLLPSPSCGGARRGLCELPSRRAHARRTPAQVRLQTPHPSQLFPGNSPCLSAALGRNNRKPSEGHHSGPLLT